LTFNSKNLIYESHCDLLIANFTFRENQIDEVRNQESYQEASKEDRSQKEKVVVFAPQRASS
jgi:hypothetical protein